MSAKRLPCRCTDARACRACRNIAGRQDYRDAWGVSEEEADDIRRRIAGLPDGTTPVAPSRRIELPAANDALSCAYRDDDPLSVPTAMSLNLPTPTRAWFRCNHPARPLKTTATGADGNGYVCKCHGCGPSCPGYATDLPPRTKSTSRVAVTNGAGGLGDAALGLLAVTALKRSDPEIRVQYRISNRGMPFVALFQGYDDLVLREAPVPDGYELRDLNVGYDVEVRTKCREPRIARYCRNIGVRGPALPALRDPAAVLAAGADMRGVIAICPFSYGGDREYAVTGWRGVEAALKREGYRTVVVHSDPNKLWAFSSERVAGVPALRVAGVLLNAGAVLGIDSGLSHLAAALGTPTVVLEGPTNVANIFRGYANVTTLAGGFPCSGCHWNGPWHKETCSPRCPSIQGIDPGRIVEAAKAAALLPPAAMERTLFQPVKVAALRDAVRATAGAAGAVAELGVYRGGSAALLCKHAGESPVHLFDTFAGLPADCPDGVHRAGEFSASKDDVVAFLRGLGYDPAVHAGVFPGTAPPDATYRFVHVDGDLYRTTKDAIDYFAPRMAAGGAILFDDYRWQATPGVARAVDAAFAGRVESVGEFQALVRF